MGLGTGKKAKKADKGEKLTLEQVEEMEGGTIKESKVGMAAMQRADRRKRKKTAEGDHISLPNPFTHSRVLDWWVVVGVAYPFDPPSLLG